MKVEMKSEKEPKMERTQLENNIDNITDNLTTLKIESENSKDDFLERGPIYNSCYKIPFSPYAYTMPPNISPSPNESFLNEPFLNDYANIMADTEVSNINTTQSKLENSKLLLCGGGIQTSSVAGATDNFQDELLSDVFGFLNEDSQDVKSKIHNQLLSDDFEGGSSLFSLLFDIDMCDVKQDSIGIPAVVTDFILERVEECTSSEKSPLSSDLGNDSLPPTPISDMSYSPRRSDSVEACESDSGCESIANGKKTSILESSIRIGSNTIYVPIYPKSNTIVPSSISQFEMNVGNNAKSSKNKVNFLAELTTIERDRFHKRMLKLEKKDGGIGKRDSEGKTFLHSIIAQKNEIFGIYFIHLAEKWLIKNPTNFRPTDIVDIESFINTQDINGKTAILYCALVNLPKMLNYLIYKGGDPTLSENITEESPLHWACNRGKTYLPVAEALCSSRKINLDQQNFKGQTALHHAIQNHLIIHKDDNHETSEIIDSKPIIELLLRRGAKLSIQDQNGRTALHLAIKTGNLELFNILHNYSCDFQSVINMQDNQGFTVLHDAMVTQLPHPGVREQILKRLLICGASKNIKDKNGRLPSDFKNYSL